MKIVRKTETWMGVALLALLLATPPVNAYKSGLKSPSQTPRKADPNAYSLLKVAHDNREVMGAELVVEAGIVLNDNGKLYEGQLLYPVGKGCALEFAEITDTLLQWTKGQVNSVLGHRRGGEFAKGDGSYPVTFGAKDSSPLGLLVNLNDRLHSSYRVRNGQVTEVTRTMGDERFTITVLETRTIEGGKYLPKHFAVTYFNAKTGEILRSQQFSDTYQKVDGVWIPAQRRIVTAEKGTFQTRILELNHIRVHRKEALTKQEE